MNNEYDGIMIGSGHNAMICCGYLAKAGLKILLIERHLEMGGGLDSHEGKGGHASKGPQGTPLVRR
jgi:phytoene dehydrogenase-like protein